MGFFQFWNWGRVLSDRDCLADCSFFDLHITEYVRDWPGAPDFRPAHPGLFEDFFPTLLTQLVGTTRKLTLYVKSIDRTYFHEPEVIATLLAPRNLEYVLLSNPLRPGDSRTQIDPGHLVFEWPVDSLAHVVEHWFMSPIVTVEGYVSSELPLGRIADLYFQRDTAERIRELLRVIDFGFRVWKDNNGLFLATDKFDHGGLEERLEVPRVNRLLAEAIEPYQPFQDREG